MSNRQKGFTLIELVVVLSIIALMLAFMTPYIMEPIRNAKIAGAVQQAKEVVSACNLVRVGPASSSRDPINNKVYNAYGPLYTSWTNATTLKAKLASDYYLPTVNPFGQAYLFKMGEKTCTAAVDLDVQIDGWEGYELESIGSRTRIIVGLPARGGSAPAWVLHQKRLLNAETIR